MTITLQKKINLLKIAAENKGLTNSLTKNEDDSTTLNKIKNFAKDLDKKLGDLIVSGPPMVGSSIESYVQKLKDPTQRGIDYLANRLRKIDYDPKEVSKYMVDHIQKVVPRSLFTNIGGLDASPLYDSVFQFGINHPELLTAIAGTGLGYALGRRRQEENKGINPWIAAGLGGGGSLLAAKLLKAL